MYAICSFTQRQIAICITHGYTELHKERYNTRILWLLDRQLPLSLCRMMMQKNMATFVINSEKIFVRERHIEDIGNVRSLNIHSKTNCSSKQQTHRISQRRDSVQEFCGFSTKNYPSFWKYRLRMMVKHMAKLVVNSEKLFVRDPY